MSSKQIQFIWTDQRRVFNNNCLCQVVNCTLRRSLHTICSACRDCVYNLRQSEAVIYSLYHYVCCHNTCPLTPGLSCGLLPSTTDSLHGFGPWIGFFGRPH